MNDSPLDAVDKLLAAMNAHDAAAVVALMTDDVSFREPTYAEPRVGRDAVRQEMSGFFAMLPDIEFKLEAAAADGDLVFTEVSYTATYEGRPVQLRECSVSRLSSGGLYSDIRVYFDRLTLLRQLGLPVE